MEFPSVCKSTFRKVLTKKLLGISKECLTLKFHSTYGTAIQKECALLVTRFSYYEKLLRSPIFMSSKQMEGQCNDEKMADEALAQSFRVTFNQMSFDILWDSARIQLWCWTFIMCKCFVHKKYIRIPGTIFPPDETRKSSSFNRKKFKLAKPAFTSQKTGQVQLHFSFRITPIKHEHWRRDFLGNQLANPLYVCDFRSKFLLTQCTLCDSERDDANFMMTWVLFSW